MQPICLHGRRTSALAALLSTSLLSAQIPPQPFPPPPTNLQVFHNSGQTFLTWTEVATITGESYRIYRVDAATGPIASVAGLTPVFEVWEDSAEMYADRIQQNTGTPNPPRYVQRCVIQDDQPQLPAGTGLCVLTLRAADFPTGSAGGAYYAVTTVAQNGIESQAVTAGPGGNGSGLVAEAVADPRPVRVGFDPANAFFPLTRIFIQYLDCRRVNTSFLAPNALNGHWGENPGQPHIANARVYACTYKVSVQTLEPTGPRPVIVRLHVHAGNRMPANYGLPDHDAIQIEPIDVNDTWWFGFARSHDYRAGLGPQTGRVANFTEARVLRMVFDLLRDPNYQADPDRVYVHGHSMGGSGALAFAMRYPDVFAAAFASKPMTDYAAYANSPVEPDGDYRQSLLDMWGSVSLPTQFDAPAGWAAHLQAYAGTANRVWRWQNHRLQLSNMMKEEMVPFGIVQGLNDATIPGDTQCEPFHGDLAAARRACAALVNCSGHSPAAFTGMPPALAPLQVGAQLVPFHGLQVRRSESVPGFSNLVAIVGPALCVPPSSCLSCPCSGCGVRYFRDLEWAASWVVAANPWAPAPVDTTTRWELSLRTPVGSGKVYAVDVTPRRLQSFRPQPFATYSWWNVQAGTVVANGTAVADADGILTIPGFTITELGNRLVVF